VQRDAFARRCEELQRQHDKERSQRIARPRSLFDMIIKLAAKASRYDEVSIQTHINLTLHSKTRKQEVSLQRHMFSPNTNMLRDLEYNLPEHKLSACDVEAQTQPRMPSEESTILKHG
jgi:hypothetical protein